MIGTRTNITVGKTDFEYISVIFDGKSRILIMSDMNEITSLNLNNKNTKKLIDALQMTLSKKE